MLCCLWERLGRLLQHKLRLYAVGELDLRELQRGLLLGLGKVRRGTARHEHIALLHGHAVGVHVVDVEAATHALIDRLGKLRGGIVQQEAVLRYGQRVVAFEERTAQIIIYIGVSNRSLYNRNY